MTISANASISPVKDYIFDGSDDYIELSNLTFGSNITIQFFAKWDTIANN